MTYLLNHGTRTIWPNDSITGPSLRLALANSLMVQDINEHRAEKRYFSMTTAKLKVMAQLRGWQVEE